MPLAPAPRSARWRRNRAPVIGKALVSGGGGFGNNGVGPVVIGDNSLGHEPALGASQPAGFDEDADPFQSAALPAVGDVDVVHEQRPMARRVAIPTLRCTRASTGTTFDGFTAGLGTRESL